MNLSVKKMIRLLRLPRNYLASSQGTSLFASSYTATARLLHLRDTAYSQVTREQIIRFNWEPKKQMRLVEDLIQKRLDRATEARAKILNAREDVAYRDQEQRMEVANEALNLIRLLGNACVSCFFAADKNKAREEELERVYGFASSYLASVTTNHQQVTANRDFQSRAAVQAAADRLTNPTNQCP